MLGHAYIARVANYPARTNRFFVPSKVLPNGTFKHFAVNPHEIVLGSKYYRVGFWDTLSLVVAITIHPNNE